MNTRTLLVVFLIFTSYAQQAYSQFGFSHEIGFITGPVQFRSDFGERGDGETNFGNTGFGIGLVHYINFSYRADCNCYTRDTYFNDHFKIRNELSYHKTNLEHLGEYVADDETSEFADQLRAMKGASSVIDLGSQLEFFPLSIRDFAAGGYKIAPFVSLGVHYVNYNPEVTSSLGPLSEVAPNAATPAKYVNSFQNEPGSTFSIVTSIGVRYKLTPLWDLMVDSRWQYYFSDWVDGLNPEFDNNGLVVVPENKYNDWIYWLNVGLIYYID